MKITVLHPVNKIPPTKRFDSNGEEIKVTAYPKIFDWKWNIISLENTHDYHHLNLHGFIIIRGTPNAKAQLNKGSVVNRDSDNFTDQGCDWLMIDVDKYETSCDRDGVNFFIENELPKEFHGVACSVQFSSSAGILVNNQPIKPGLNCHLMFALERPLLNIEVKQWLSKCNIDKSLYSATQPHYVTDPIIAKNITINLPERRFFIDGKPFVKPPSIQPMITTDTKPFHNHNPNPPTLRSLMACDFIKHFIEAGIQSGEGRYQGTRAFCHNVIHADGGPKIVDEALKDSKHESAIRRSLNRFEHPICCSTFLPDIKFQCPKFNGTRCITGAKAPIAISWRHKQ